MYQMEQDSSIHICSSSKNSSCQQSLYIIGRIFDGIDDKSLQTTIQTIMRMGIYKSFNYEIFERRPSAVVAFDGNSAAINLIQEAKNSKGQSAIFVWSGSKNLMQKAKSLQGYVYSFDSESTLVQSMQGLQQDFVEQ